MTLSSYPFLELSRRLDIPYGEVLALASAYLKLGKEKYDWWEADAILKHSERPEVVNDVINTVHECRVRWPGIMSS